ncbi:anthranilate phosphoribosyltransferase [Pseudomonas sp. S1(2024)]|uniref:anthranilate phosphoribosyltransferase n=1 Tax=Pseudomonas sp. S1(2024) TaxID=3390191 RepID=UPI00397C095F
MPQNVRDLVMRYSQGESLPAAQLQGAFGALMQGRLPDSLIAALLTAMQVRGFQADEIETVARVVREHLIPVQHACKGPLIDLCGTGGDARSTFNVSTTSSFVVAAAGVRVAKHGNRSVSSTCGSADVMEALGLHLDLGPEQIARCLEEIGIGFMFSPVHRPALPGLTRVRSELAMRTIFNVVGPLTNPARVDRQLLGVFSAELVPIMAQVLDALGSERAMVVHGLDGLDEISLSGATVVAELKDGCISEYLLHPSDFGLVPQALDALRVKSVAQARQMFLDVLQGQPGAPRDIVLLNSAAALHVCGKVASMAEGVTMAARAVDSGQAMHAYESLLSFTQGLRN